MIKKIIHSLHIVGHRRFQKVFERLYSFSLTGMNIGTATGIYEDGEMEVMKYVHGKKAHGNFILFDVGANVGKYTRALAEEFGSRAAIYSFEPSPKTFQTLSRNIASYEVCTGKTNLQNIGLGDTSGEVSLFTDADNSGLASVYQRRLDHFNVSMDKKETVTLKTLDEFCEKNNIGSIDFLKMDVEGHELSVLHGAKKMLAKKAIQYIQFEFGGNNIDSRTFFQDFYYLLKDDFKLFRVVKDGLHPITEYRESYECFLCSTFFAERK